MDRLSKPDPAVPIPDAPAVLKTAWEVHRVPLMAALTAKLGDLDRAEEALAEAALRAHRSWAVTIPDNPSGWLYRVALNAARDSQRRETVRLKAAPTLEAQYASANDGPLTVSPEARLNLFRLCAAPNLSTEQQIALMLFHLGGLNCARIAAAFLVTESVIYQRLSRARSKLKSSDRDLRDSGDLAPIRSALEVIYHQSYRDVAGGTEAGALGRDAIHLTQALCSAGPDDPENWALLAFLHSLDARRPARLSEDGVFIPFDAQDVTRWSSPSLRDAAAAMQKAASLATGPQPYGLRAQIEMTRIIARQEGRCCDTELRGLYDGLMRVAPSPFARIEQALIIARLEGASAGLSALSDIPANTDLSGHAGWHLAKADLHNQAGDRAQTQLHLKAALTLVVGEAERNFVRAKLDSLLP